ncbi:MAG TPA: hypothetical protein VJL81_07410 [Solirubrobacterales bacterium]|nr:hypothetical protein [Solirubrobacterales bacterium]
MLGSRLRILFGTLAVGLSLAVLASAAAAAVKPLKGIYVGTDSTGGRIAFSVFGLSGGPDRGMQIVDFRGGGSYESICSPQGLVIGPLFGGWCRGGPFPDPHPADTPWIFGQVDFKGVYADRTANADNNAAFNGTVKAAALVFSTEEPTSTEVEGGEGGPDRTIPYPELSWRAVLVDPAAVATAETGGLRVTADDLRLPLHCKARGVPACAGTVTAAWPGRVSRRARFDVPAGLSREVALPVPQSRGRSGTEVERLKLTITSEDGRTRTVRRHAVVALPAAGEPG